MIKIGESECVNVSSGTGSPGWSRTKGRKMVVVVVAMNTIKIAQDMGV